MQADHPDAIALIACSPPRSARVKPSALSLERDGNGGAHSLRPPWEPELSRRVNPSRRCSL